MKFATAQERNSNRESYVCFIQRDTTLDVTGCPGCWAIRLSWVLLLDSPLSVHCIIIDPPYLHVLPPCYSACLSSLLTTPPLPGYHDYFNQAFFPLLRLTFWHNFFFAFPEAYFSFQRRLSNRCLLADSGDNYRPVSLLPHLLALSLLSSLYTYLFIISLTLALALAWPWEDDESYNAVPQPPPCFSSPWAREDGWHVCDGKAVVVDCEGRRFPMARRPKDAQSGRNAIMSCNRFLSISTPMKKRKKKRAQCPFGQRHISHVRVEPLLLMCLAAREVSITSATFQESWPTVSSPLLFASQQIK